MAEITTPKPYRDFYVTDSIASIRSGYVETDTIEGHSSKVVTFQDEKHGFSLTNEGVENIVTSMDLRNTSLLNSIMIDTTTGKESVAEDRLSTDFIPVNPSREYKITLTSTEENAYRYIYVKYDAYKNVIGYAGWVAPAIHTFQLEKNCHYLRLMVKKEDGVSVSIPITNEMFLNETTAFMIERLSALPTITRLTVTESVPVPAFIGGWEQGSIVKTTGVNINSPTEARTIDCIPVYGSVYYTLNGSYLNGTLYSRIVEYDENGNYIKGTNNMPALPYTFKTDKRTRNIRFTVNKDTTTQFTPEHLNESVDFIRLTAEPMIIQADDTRKVVMPPFTELYIESEVPYHGYVYTLE